MRLKACVVLCLSLFSFSAYGFFEECVLLFSRALPAAFPVPKVNTHTSQIFQGQKVHGKNLLMASHGGMLPAREAILDYAPNEDLLISFRLDGNVSFLFKGLQYHGAVNARHHRGRLEDTSDLGIIVRVRGLPEDNAQNLLDFLPDPQCIFEGLVCKQNVFSLLWSAAGIRAQGVRFLASEMFRRMVLHGAELYDGSRLQTDIFFPPGITLEAIYTKILQREGDSLADLPQRFEFLDRLNGGDFQTGLLKFHLNDDLKRLAREDFARFQSYQRLINETMPNGGGIIDTELLTLEEALPADPS